MLIYLENLFIYFFWAQQITFLRLKYSFCRPLDSATRSGDITPPSPHLPYHQLYAPDCKKSVQSTTCYSWTAFSLRTVKRPPLLDFKGTTWFQLAEHQCCVAEEFTNHSSIPFTNSTQYVSSKGFVAVPAPPVPIHYLDLNITRGLNWCFFFPPMALQPLVGEGPFIVEVSI